MNDTNGPTTKKTRSEYETNELDLTIKNIKYENDIITLEQELNEIKKENALYISCNKDLRYQLDEQVAIQKAYMNELDKLVMREVCECCNKIKEF